MAHTIYDNFYLSNEIEDQFNSHLDLQQFCTVDTSLEVTPGMLRKIKAIPRVLRLATQPRNTASFWRRTVSSITMRKP